MQNSKKGGWGSIAINEDFVNGNVNNEMTIQKNEDCYWVLTILVN